MINYLLNIDPLILSILATTFTFLLTALGSLIVIFFKKPSKSFLDGTLAFSAGIMISASFFSLLSPAINMGNNTISITLGFLAGGVIIFICDKVSNKTISNKKKRSFLLLSSITIHNIPEGLAVGVAFGSLYLNHSKESLIAALIVALGIGIQNFPEGTSISLPLRRDGVKKSKAFILGSLSAVVEPIFGIIGTILVKKSLMILPFSLSFAAGAMIYVAVKELVPESMQNKNKTLMGIITIIGFALMMYLDIIFS